MRIPVETVLAELGAAAELVGDYRRRVGQLAGGLGTEREDLTTAIDEAKRSLEVAERTIRRAIKVASDR